MFDTPEFRKMLETALESAVSARSLSGYDRTIIDSLQSIAVDVSSRTLPDIEACAEVEPVEVRSAKAIAKTAAAIAQDAGRQYILWGDVEAAIGLKFCTVYPFCQPEE
jgi:histone H3/H4